MIVIVEWNRVFQGREQGRGCFEHGDEHFDLCVGEMF